MTRTVVMHTLIASKVDLPAKSEPCLWQSIEAALPPRYYEERQVVKIVLAGLAAVLLPVTAPAQQTPAPASAVAPFESQTYQGEMPSLNSTDPLRRSIVPRAVQREQLRKAVALRAEVARLQAADGGTLSPRNQRYVQRKSREILAYAGPLPGVVAGSQ